MAINEDAWCVIVWSQGRALCSETYLMSNDTSASRIDEKSLSEKLKEYFGDKSEANDLIEAIEALEGIRIASEMRMLKNKSGE